MRAPTLPMLTLMAMLSAVPASAALDAAWRAVPPSTPGDSLAIVLGALEARPQAGVRPGEVAFARGEFHYARGEYRQAAAAFARAAEKLTGSERGESRYRQGLSLLGANDPAAAMDPLQDASRWVSRRSGAQVALAFAWEAQGKPDRAYAILSPLGGKDLDQVTPAALERLATLAERFRRTDEARRARERLAREWPRSLEAARIGVRAEPAASATAGPVRLQIGAFADRGRADALAAQARRQGFARARVVQRAGRDQRDPLFVVELGEYATRDAAREAGAKAERALGVAWQVTAR